MIDAKRAKEFWNNVKAMSTDANTEENQINFTGGGPAISNIHEEHAQLLDIVPKILPVIKIEDSDTVEGQEDDDDSIIWTHTMNGEINISPTGSLSEVVTAEEFADDIARTETVTSEEVVEACRAQDQPTLESSGRDNITRSILNEDSLESVKLSIMKQDLRNREKKFEMETSHLLRMHELERHQKELEIEHKKKMFKFCEEEMELKIQLLKNKIYH